MAFTKETHHEWVLNFFKSKVREWGFHLDWLTKCCDRSMSQFLHRQVQSDDDFSHVVYAFSSFSNAIQTLKDAGSALFDEGLPWSDIDQLRHGKFIHLSRNAATHDGNPIISAWADGKFFVPNEIRRLNQKGQEVEILAPTVDARRPRLDEAGMYRQCRPPRGYAGTVCKSRPGRHRNWLEETSRS